MSIDYRAIHIIKETIKGLELNLNAYHVLTEVGSNNYIYTPIIPLLAGAKKVFAWTRDSSYGKGVDIVEQCLEIATYLGLEDRIEFSINYKNEDHIRTADIITNSGFIRPINEAVVKLAKTSAVVPLMFESWEIRPQDSDLEACSRMGVKVSGTWENHPKIKVFDYVMELTLKMLFEAGYEIRGNSFIIWSNDHFGEKAEEALKLNGVEDVVVTTNYEVLKSNIEGKAAVLLFDYHASEPYFGSRGLFNLQELKDKNNYFGVLHLYGDVDHEFLIKNKVNVYPKKQGKPQVMTFTLAHVGLIPVLNLLTAGFKVAQETLEKNLSSLSQPVNFNIE